MGLASSVFRCRSSSNATAGRVGAEPARCGYCSARKERHPSGVERVVGKRDGFHRRMLKKALLKMNDPAIHMRSALE